MTPDIMAIFKKATCDTLRLQLEELVKMQQTLSPQSPEMKEMCIRINNLVETLDRIEQQEVA